MGHWMGAIETAEGKGPCWRTQARGYILAADPTPAAPDPGRLN